MALDALLELAGAALRSCARIVFELVFEIFLHYTGWAMLKPFYRRKSPGDTLCMMVGLVFWVLVAVTVVLIHSGANA